MNNENLKQAVRDVIKQNGTGAITGEVMQSTLLTIINHFGSGSIFAGIAIPTTNPNNTDVNMFYLAKDPGTYTNFGSYVLGVGKLVLFTNKSGIWVAIELIDSKSGNIPYYSDLVMPVNNKETVIDNNGVWKLKTGQTANTGDLPTNDVSSKWNLASINWNSSYRDFTNTTLEVGALALNNGATTGSSTRGRTSVFVDIANAFQLELIGDMLIQNIFYYTDLNVFISTQVVNAKTFVPTIPGTAKKFKVSLYHVVNTQEVTQLELNALKLNLYTSKTNTLKDIVDSAKKSEKVATDYGTLTINLADGVYKELGGIDVTNGNDSNNNIRIRTEKIPVLSGNYSLTQDSGFVISRVVYYKDGVFVSYGTLPDFAIDNTTVNQLRLVWSKTNATVVITQAEVDAFKFVLQNLTVSKFDQMQNQSKSVATKGNSWFVNKKMTSIGDSITYGFTPRNYPGYPGQIDSYAKQTAALLGLQWDNRGISGSTIGQLGSDTTTNSPMINRISVMAADAKIVTFNGGVNDLRKIHVLGVMSDRVPSTFYGAMHLLIQGILNKYVYSQSLTLAKDILIVGITPMRTYPDTPISGLTLIQYVNAFKEVCSYYAIPYFDAFNLSGLTPEEFRTLQGTEPGYTDMYNPLVPDGTHPGKEGNAIWARAFAGFLKSLVS